MRNWLCKFVVFVGIASLFTFSACSKPKQQPVKAPAQAGNFILSGINGEKIELLNVLKEKKAVLLFWSTWCPYCRIELPQMEEFHRQHKDKVQIIAIDVGESRAQVERYLQQTNISYQVVLDLDGAVASAYNVLGVPTIVAVDKDAQVLYYGHSSAEMIEQLTF